MGRIHDARTLAAGASAHGFEQLLEQMIQTARTHPARVVAAARKRGLPVHGATLPEQLFSLRSVPPGLLDPLASGFVRSNSVVAGAQGFVTNVGGLATWAVMLPADAVGALYWVVRATSGVMASYGFEAESEQGAAQLRIGLLVATGISSVSVEGTRVLLDQASRQLLSTPSSQRLLIAGAGKLAAKLGLDLTRGRLAKAVPLMGGAVGGALNAGMVTALGRRARRHYRGLLEEWQREHTIEIAEPTDVRRLPPPPH